MARSFLCNKLFYSQLRQLHRSAVTCSTPTFNLVNEKKDFQYVWPEVINSLMMRSKLNQLPEVANWVKKVSTYLLIFK